MDVQVIIDQVDRTCRQKMIEMIIENKNVNELDS